MGIGCYEVQAWTGLDWNYEFDNEIEYSKELQEDVKQSVRSLNPQGPVSICTYEVTKRN